MVGVKQHIEQVVEVAASFETRGGSNSGYSKVSTLVIKFAYKPTNVFMSTVPGAPEQIKALVMTSDSIMVTWTRPSEPNGNIIKFNVYIQHANKVSKDL